MEPTTVTAAEPFVAEAKSGNGQSTVIPPSTAAVPSPAGADLHRLGLRKLIQECKARVAGLFRARGTVENEEAATLAEFQTLAEKHDHPDRNLPGFEATTRPYHTEMAEAARDRWFAIATGVLAVIFGTYFSSKTLVAYSMLWLTVACVVVAALLGAVATGVLGKATDATPKNPDAKGVLRKVTYYTGGTVFAVIAIFLFLRFVVEFDYPFLLPIVIVTTELGLIITAASFECARNVGAWSGPLNKRFHKLAEEKAAIDSKIQEEEQTLTELEARLRIYDKSKENGGAR